jgi:hypothetical protein
LNVAVLCAFHQSFLASQKLHLPATPMTDEGRTSDRAGGFLLPAPQPAANRRELEKHAASAFAIRRVEKKTIMDIEQKNDAAA